MKRLLAAVGLALAATVPLALPAAAQSQGWVTTNVNLRSGPGVEYPPVLVVPAGAPVAVYGCLEGYGWCDVSFNEARGFVSGNMISFEYQSVRRPAVEIGPQLALPIIAFTLGNYWDNHYRGRPFYRERDRWEHRAYSAPPPRYRGRDYDRRPYYVDRPSVPRPPVYRPDYNDRSRFDNHRRDDRRRDDFRRDDRRRDDHRNDAGRRFREQQREQQRVQERRPDFRPDVRRGPDRPAGISGGQTERDARRFNEQRRGPQAGE